MFRLSPRGLHYTPERSVRKKFQSIQIVELLKHITVVIEASQLPINLLNSLREVHQSLISALDAFRDGDHEIR